MNPSRAASIVVAALVAACAAPLVGQGGSAAVAGRLYASDAASRLVGQGLLLPPPPAADRESFTVVPPPGVRNVPNTAQATTAPWVDSNAWRFHRGVRKADYAQLPAGSAALAAAEAFTYGVDAILNPAPADLDELAAMLAFLRANGRPPLPPLANIGVVDDGSPVMGEVLNMLTRRNLLYVLRERPDRALDLTVQLDAPAFPRAAAANPADFAARVRAALGDERRLVRLFGTSTVIAHLTGDAARARLFLLSYSNNRRQSDIRVRVRGTYRPAGLAAHGSASDARLADVAVSDGATELTVPSFSTIAIVDLQPSR